VPTFDASDAIHSARNIPWRSGDHGDRAASDPAGASALRAIVKLSFRMRCRESPATRRTLYEAVPAAATHRPHVRRDRLLAGLHGFTSSFPDATLRSHVVDLPWGRDAPDAGAAARREGRVNTPPQPIAARRIDLPWLASRAAARAHTLLGEPNRALFAELVRAAFKHTDHNSVAGALWSLLAPFAMLSALYLVFRERFGEELRAYPLFLLLGIALVSYFATVTRRLIAILFANRALLLNTTVPRETVILSQVAFHGYKLLVEMVLCTLLAVYYGTLTWHGMLAMVPLVMGFLALVTGVGMLGAVLFSFARDVEHIWTLVTHLLMFVTPVFYGLESLSAPARFIIYWLNPLTPFLVALRGALIGPPAGPGVYVHAMLVGATVLVVGYAAFLTAESAAMERT